jgi:hypothetical protein
VTRVAALSEALEVLEDVAAFGEIFFSAIWFTSSYPLGSRRSLDPGARPGGGQHGSILVASVRQGVCHASRDVR